MIYASLPRWRVPVLVLLSVLTGLALLAIPRLRAVFAPEELVPAAPGEAARARALLGPFGEGEEPLLVVIEARDVLAIDALRAQHRIARTLAGRPWIARVDGVTVTPLPRLVEITDAATLDTLDDREDPIDEVIARVIATDPRRFPMGLLSLSERTGGRRFVLAPAVQGEVDEDERAAIAMSRSLEGRLVDADHRLALIVVVPRPGEDLEARARSLDRWLASQDLPRGVRLELAGMPAVRITMIDDLRSDQVRLVALAIVGSLLVLIAGMRSWSGTILPLASAGMSSAFVVGAMAMVGEPLNLLNNTVAPLLITIGLGDAVHLIARYREELRRTPDRFLAARRTMEAMTAACFLTSATTAVGFGSLVVSETSIVRHYAIIAGLGVMLGYVVTILFLPAALTGMSLRDRRERAPNATLERVASWIARASARRAWAVLAGAIVLLAAALYVGKDVRVDSTLSGQLDPDAPTRRTFERIESRLSGVRTLEIGLRGRFDQGRELARLARFERWLRAQPGVMRVEGPPDLLGESWTLLSGDPDAASEALRDPARTEALVDLAREAAPALLARHLAEDGRRARIEVRLADSGESGIAALIARIERRLSGWEGVEHAVGGEAARSARGLDRLIRDLGGSVGIAMAIIFVMIGALLRSARLGLISILPNVLPLAMTLAYMAIRDIPLHAATTIVFSVSIGLAVDDTIHILARYREEIAIGRRRTAAMLRSLRSSGRAAVVSAGAIWVGYATLMFASFVPIRLFGELSLVALGTALICEIIVLPALLVVFGAVTRPSGEPRSRRSPR